MIRYDISAHILHLWREREAGGVLGWAWAFVDTQLIYIV